ncbi:YbaB/EbfC family nucleoid-associated protein [Roseibacillus ishigakijimensis]|uniref:Nucleoid-associated protein JIN78_09555 n=1 Tax=Roseibacillus ishigakijimensis TaxID=454146 RepID=A0A934VHS7_9BACT|nr:YbaB/EbfC family nucleoid-associated protein [Roseibacillus ishigakijimensis]MBK1834303.1 YbaB/EbfC family nucleoid-associated protein [Roseibacillus ishigakijimensis]
MNIAKLMEQAKKLQEAQADLSNKTAQASDPSGKVTAVATGAGELQSLTIDPAIISSDDAEFLQNLILTTCNTALKEARDQAAKEMAANFKIPGMG